MVFQDFCAPFGEVLTRPGYFVNILRRFSFAGSHHALQVHEHHHRCIKAKDADHASHAKLPSQTTPNDRQLSEALISPVAPVV